MNNDVVKYILDNENEDVSKLLLKQKDILGYSPTFIANQINGRRRASVKLPTWYANPNIIYPPQQNLEQCSSQETAKFKAQIVNDEKPGNTLADLTGGFGVDSFFFSKEFEVVKYIEPNEELCGLAITNHKILNATNIDHINSNAEAYLKKNQKFDWAYIDPSRKKKGQKVFSLSDCEPNALALLPLIFKAAPNILLKASPLLDLKAGIRQLQNVKKVFVVSVDDECKEVLFLLNAEFSNKPKIICVNLPNNEQKFEFSFEEEEHAIVNFDDPKEFLYEPNTSILKAGAFKVIASRNGLKKIATNTHLYTGPYVNNFPGRIFKNVGVLENPGKQLSGKANIISRNFPLTPDQIKKKFKLNDGGDKYLIAFSGMKKKFLIVADRLQ